MQLQANPPLTAPMPEAGVTLVLGSDSYVGGALMRHLRRLGRPVCGTTRRREAVDSAHMYLDLAGDPAEWALPPRVAAAIVCAGITKLAACSSRPRESAAVNVEAVSALASRLAAEGAFVVYVSSSQVFDGSAPDRREDEPVSPANEYGRQKAEAERRLLALGNRVAVVRLTRVLGPALQPFTEWTQALQLGRTIEPFEDMVMAPIPLSCVVTVVELVVHQRLPGVLHVSGAREVSYADAARCAARVLNAEESLVRPVSALRSGRHTERVWQHATLSVTRLRSAFGIEPPNVDWTIETLFANPSALAGVG